MKLKKGNCKEEFPQDPWKQLWTSIKTILELSHNKRVDIDTRTKGNSKSKDSTVIIQAMVFGNESNESGSGLTFTRNPITGENKIYGEYLLNSQIDDIIAGNRTGRPIYELEATKSELYQQLLNIAQILGKYHKDVQCIEFFINKKNLYILKT